MADALFTSTPIKVDGFLDEPVWQQAPAYELTLSQSKLRDGRHAAEKGWVRFAWDRNFFYLGAQLEDSDVVQQDSGDQKLFFQTGDVLELFLKPLHHPFYWELYVTPNGYKTSLFFPSRGYLGLPSAQQYTCGLKVAAQVDGTLNNWRELDRGWTAEMAMPVGDLSAFGVPFSSEVPWTVFVGRYNYSCHLSQRELTMYPALSETNCHLHEEWAPLRLVSGPAEGALARVTQAGRHP